ncbi:MAG: hypothetical protein ABUL69_05215, partial [Peristeroidobacter soli]
TREGLAMSERRQPVFDPDAAIRTVVHDSPAIETPIINIQDEEQKVLDALAEFEREYARLRQAGP